MVTPSLGSNAPLLLYGGLLVATPLSIVLVLRIVDRLSLDGYVDQYQEVAPEAGRGLTAPPATDGGGDGGGDARGGHACPRCGERNEPGYTFCRGCLGRIDR